MAKTFLFKITPNNKDIIINTDVLLNGYEDVEYPIPFKQTKTLGYVLDPNTFKFTDSESMIQELNAYPINMELEAVFDPLPFYGVNKFHSEDKIIYYSPNKFNSNVGLSQQNYSFIAEDNHDIITIQPDITGYITNLSDNYYSANYTIIIKIYWSDEKSHAEELKNYDFTHIVTTIGTYPLFIKITPKILDTDNVHYYTNLKEIILPSNKTTFLKINDTPSDILYDRDILMFNISVTFTDPITQLSIMSTTSVNVMQQGFIGKRQGYVLLKQLYLDPIDVWSPTVTENFTKSINNEANPKVDKTSQSEYYSFEINSSFIIDKNNYNYTHVFMQDILPYPTISDFIIVERNYNNQNLPSIKTPNDDPSVNYEADKDYINNTMSSYQDKYERDYITYCSSIGLTSFGNLKYNDVILHHYYTDNTSQNASISIINSSDWDNFCTRFNTCTQYSDDSDDSIYQIPYSIEAWESAKKLNTNPTTYIKGKNSEVIIDSSLSSYNIINKCITNSKLKLQKLNNKINNNTAFYFDINFYRVTGAQNFDNSQAVYKLRIIINISDNLDISISFQNIIENQFKLVNYNFVTPTGQKPFDNYKIIEQQGEDTIIKDVNTDTRKFVYATYVENNITKYDVYCISYLPSTKKLSLTKYFDYDNYSPKYPVFNVEVNVSSETISYDKTFIEIKQAKYRARYAKYYIEDETYKQLYLIYENGQRPKNGNSDEEPFYNINDEDIDCQNFTGSGTKLPNNAKLTNYKLKTLSDGKTIQYKFCINNLFNTYKDNNGNDKTIQIPRFGVYPILEGFVPFLFEDGFDYTNDEDFPILKMSFYNYTHFCNIDDIKNNQCLKKNEYGIWYIDTDKLSEKIGKQVSSKAPILNNLITSPISSNISGVIPGVINRQQIGDAGVLTDFVINGTEGSTTGGISDGRTTAGGAGTATVDGRTTAGGTGTGTGTVGGRTTVGGNGTATVGGRTEGNSGTIRTSLYGAGSNTEQYTLSINNLLNTELYNILRINGVKCNDLKTGNNIKFYSKVNPYIFTISLDEYPKDLSTCINVTISNNNGNNTIQGKLLFTNDENEKSLTHYLHDGKDINSDHNTFMLLRANPKLSGNIKLVVDSNYNLYLDTFKISSKLNDQRLRKYPISAEGNYPRDIKHVFKDIPSTEIYKVPENSLKAHKVYTDFNDQYETIYEYGAETNKDNLYDENMKILAPIHIGKDIPQFFAIFRYDDVFNEETYNGNQIDDIIKFKSLISKSKVIKTFDLRTYTSIGQYLNNYKDMLTNYGQCYLQFIEQDYDMQSKTYRQGTNIWKGISIKRGILTNQSESSYFAARLLNDENITNKQEVFNNFIMKGFERNNLLYPNIINLEFMFNDNDKEEYSMHRYFGLYLSENDFINYGYIISNNLTFNHIFDKYDLDGNLYKGDRILFNNIFTNVYKNRIFYAITNDNAERVQSEVDVNNFLVKYVKNLPESNLTSIQSDQIVYAENERSFITLHFKKAIKYGEHFKFIALNKTKDFKSYTNSAENNSETNRVNELPYDHIVYEIIASNDERLRTTDNHISPYVNTLACIYSENTYFYRLSFYTQDVDYPEVQATLSEQIKRIVACIEKFNSFIKVQSFNNISFSVISEHDEMYFQHIDAVDLTDFHYDYINWTNINSPIYTTNKEYSESIDFLPHSNINYVTEYDQAIDDVSVWLTNLTTNTNSEWRHYIEVSDPRNIKEDSISYFNKDVKYNMFALTNQSDYFDGYYAAFSNYCFETLGWRYNNIVKFINVKNLTNSYVIYKDMYEFIKDIKFPIILNDADKYETLNIFNIKYGYLRNNIYDPDIYENYTTIQQFIFNDENITAITSPYNVNYSMIWTTGNVLLKNNVIQVYKPKYANIAVMGISNIKDLDMVVDLERINHQETKLSITIPADETINVDESDYRIQHGVMYQLISGKLYYSDDEYIPKNDKFIIIRELNNQNTYVYQLYISSYGFTTITKLFSKSEVIYKICDKQIYQDFDYNTNIPSEQTKNFYIDLDNIETSELVYPIVPLVQCNWKSNGQYFDFNNVLDVSSLNKNYEYIGSFTENVYTPSDFNVNQYVTNKIDNLLYVDNKPMTYKECILNNSVQHPIKKLLIDNVNIDTASAYYNSNTQSLEFIFSGIKFNIKLNSKIINTFIHLDEYTGFEVFVINDYDVSKRNELYISQIEKFILLINHQFYIDYEHEAVSNIKNITTNDFKEYVDYSAFKAPYSIDFKTTYIDNNGNVMSHKKTEEITKSLYDVIDNHNLWSSLFIQFNIPKLLEKNNNPQFIQSYIEAINEFKNYITFDHDKSDIGLLGSETAGNSGLNTIINSTTIRQALKLIYSDVHPYIITKADGEYNHKAYMLLNSINNQLIKILETQQVSSIINNNPIPIDNTTPEPINDVTPINNGNTQGGVVYGARLAPSNSTIPVNTHLSMKTNVNLNDVIIYTPNIITDNNIKLNEDYLSLRYILNNEEKSPLLSYLSNLLNTPLFNVFVNQNNISKYDNIIIPKSYLDELQEYIEILITRETPREKLERYTKTFDNNIDIYIIPVNEEVKYIKNTNEYNPLIFELTIPNRIKFNYGWFTPNTNNMVEFYVHDELEDILNVDLLLSNTKIKDIYRILNYTGNKVFEDNKLYNLYKNYFIIPTRSLLSSTWDTDYYRKYFSEDSYNIEEGHITGIDDKSFFGSKCMVIKKEYIELDTWIFDTANDIYNTYITDSNFNTQSTNVQSFQLNINLTSALFNHFINNKVFKENWNYFKDSQYTGMKNYINNTISSAYNMNSNLEIILYYIDKDTNEPINIINKKPKDINSYNIYEGYSTALNLKDSIYTLKINIPKSTGMNIYPTIKIYRK